MGLAKPVVAWQHNGQLATPVLAMGRKAATSAPVQKGDQVASTSLADDSLGYLPRVNTQQVNLIATQNVGKLNIFERFFRWLGNLF